MPNVVAESYLDTMDNMVQWTLDGAERVNRVQMVVLVMEGVVLCGLALFYMWVLSLQVRL